jgi:hypothetical protein
MNFKRGDVVICVDNGHINLTVGRRYRILSEGPLVAVTNDLGSESTALEERFILDEGEEVKRILKEYET